MRNFQETWQLFLLDCKNSLRPFSKKKSCSWNYSYCVFWAYVSCQCTNIMCNLAQLSRQKAKKQLSLFVSMGKWLWHLPQPRFLPRLGLWGCIQVFGCIRAPTSLGKTSARLLWLGTGSIQIGRSNPASMRERSPHCLTVHEEHNLAGSGRPGLPSFQVLGW